MKIKRSKQMRLDELIKNVWDGNLPKRTYTSDRFSLRVVFKGNGVSFNELKFGDVLETTKFPVEVEEELTEETKFDELWEVYYNKGRDDVDAYKNGKMNGVTSTSISQILEENSIDYENVTLAIFHKDTLIWSKDTGIPAEGVIEV